jgi:hypothetical protein
MITRVLLLHIGCYRLGRATAQGSVRLCREQCRVMLDELMRGGRSGGWRGASKPRWCRKAWRRGEAAWACSSQLRHSSASPPPRRPRPTRWSQGGRLPASSMKASSSWHEPTTDGDAGNNLPGSIAHGRHHFRPPRSGRYRPHGSNSCRYHPPHRI